MVRPSYHSGNRGLSGKRVTRVDDLQIASVEGPWGSLQVVMDGFPVVVSARLGGDPVAALTATRETLEDDGPVMTSKQADVPLALAGGSGGVRFVAEGGPRLTGRRRYLRAAVQTETWTYGATETATADRPTLAGRLLGSSVADLQLRRGPRPRTGQVVVEIRYATGEERAQWGAGTRELNRVVWHEGAELREVALATVLWLGTNSLKLDPLWIRAFLGAGDYI